MKQLELTRGEYGLEGRISLAAWEDGDAEEESGQIRLDFGGDQADAGEELTDSYQTALSYLFARQREVRNAILQAVASHLQQQRDDWMSGELEEAQPAPAQEAEPADLLGQLQLEEVHILPVEKDGLCYIGYGFGCRWDEDGIGVMTHGCRVVEVGSRDTALLCWLAEDDSRRVD